MSHRGDIYFGVQGVFYGEDAGEAAVPDSMSQAKGIYLGGCVARGVGRISDATKCELAHAHIGGEWKGWICFQLPQYFNEEAYHWLRMHELAHIISGQGHTDAWRAVMKELGQEIPRRHQRRQRKSRTGQ